MKFEEWEGISPQKIFVSATPSVYEQDHTDRVVEQVVRPTGLVDPQIEIRPATSQVDDLMSEISITAAKNERVLAIVLTKRMAEDLTDYLHEHGIRVRYLHSDIDTVERVEIIRDLRLGEFDVLVGINLLREGLDMPEVSLVAILDADKEGFLRSERSLIQTIGRAARNLNGRANYMLSVLRDRCKGPWTKLSAVGINKLSTTGLITLYPKASLSQCKILWKGLTLPVLGKTKVGKMANKWRKISLITPPIARL